MREPICEARAYNQAVILQEENEHLRRAMIRIFDLAADDAQIRLIAFMALHKVHHAERD